jgi:hypothetical protein
MRVLIGCEFSGIVRDAFRAVGVQAVSCDQLPSETDGPHLVGDVRVAIHAGPWDIGIFHPPCTRLTVAGARWFKGREQEQADAIAFVEALWLAPIPRIAIENPIGVLSTRSKLGKPTQIIQPWQFGHPESKATCLWLKGLPALVATHILPKPARGYWDNQTPSGQNKLGPSPTRAADRSRTYPGIAQAMAAQWGTP